VLRGTGEDVAGEGASLLRSAQAAVASRSAARQGRSVGRRRGGAMHASRRSRRVHVEQRSVRRGVLGGMDVLGGVVGEVVGEG
jgi:hypothetical protein